MGQGRYVDTVCVSVLSNHLFCNKKCLKTYSLLKTEREQERGGEEGRKGRKEKGREGKRRGDTGFNSVM